MKSAGTYSVSVVDVHGCKDLQQRDGLCESNGFYIGTFSFCDGGNTTALEAGLGYRYIWSTGETHILSQFRLLVLIQLRLQIWMAVQILPVRQLRLKDHYLLFPVPFRRYHRDVQCKYCKYLFCASCSKFYLLYMACTLRCYYSGWVYDGLQCICNSDQSNFFFWQYIYRRIYWSQCSTMIVVPVRPGLEAVCIYQLLRVVYLVIFLATLPGL